MQMSAVFVITMKAHMEAKNAGDSLVPEMVNRKKSLVSAEIQERIQALFSLQWW